MDERFVWGLMDPVQGAQGPWEEGVTLQGEGLEQAAGRGSVGLASPSLFLSPLSRTFAAFILHPTYEPPFSSAEPAYTPVPHDVLHGTPPVS